MYALLENCNWQCYLDRYPDLQTAFGDDLAAAEKHWNTHGKKEGRDCSCGNLPVSSMSLLFKTYTICFNIIFKMELFY